MFNKLQVKIIFLLFIALAITVSANYFMSNSILKDVLTDAITDRAFTTGDILKMQIDNLLILPRDLDELAGFEYICQDVVSTKDDIQYAEIVDLEGKILYSSDFDRLNTFIENEELVEAAKSVEDNTVLYKDETGTYYGFFLPVYNSKSEHLGAVFLSYTKETITGPVTKLLQSFFIMGWALFLLVLLLIGFFLNFWVTKPILSLYHATREIFYKGTDSIETVHVKTKDEIGRLATSFNLMVTKLKETTVSKLFVDNIISSMTDAVIVVSSNNTIETVNEAALSLLEYREEELLNQPVSIIFDDQDFAIFSREWVNEVKEQGQLKNYETIGCTKSGKSIPVLFSCSVMKSNEKNVAYIVCTVRDNTEAKKAEDLMYYQANFDVLTGLPNRYYMENEITRVLKEFDTNETPHTFLSLDLDKFKVVNDVCGHHAGDQLIKHLALMMKQTLQPDVILCRIGGDEFGILLFNTDISEGCKIAERLCKVVRDFHFVWNDNMFTLGVSIGAVELNSNVTSVQVLLSSADRACYISKDKGGNRVQVFDEDDKELLERHEEMNVMPGITKAFEEDRFVLHYQPIVSTKGGSSRDWFEVLIRMVDDKGNIIAPGIFLPAAQRYNVMPNIDRWVIHHFFKIYKEQVEGHFDGDDVLFNINISGASLNTDDFLDFVMEEFTNHQVPPNTICFEITETSAVSNFVDAAKFINKLQDMGCSFALDDFGSGLSSFTYLKYLPVDYIKIDGTFVREMEHNKIDYAMVSSINEIAHLMGKKTIAEYVENDEIFSCLKEIGVDFGQGFGLGRPDTLEHYM
ncbi:EAL domain-containing protein [Anaeromicropila populeti]|uniref:PAS domain S-box-containing protein/diguanylate cyclase (GGDEF) domain-containing protein n=1 Tax=Anaeromicropila populeti TaxID=37658 RepID=A0A1I6IAF8_9FIRM|nr:EAL domain-containing protein [Anaeromicropila populeti]SFR63676.1 PAS domain S-box-containing protein/diguanylate cyclase (GGDEF) domain-containing protein [Anaeromicropila populeti]